MLSTEMLPSGASGEAPVDSGGHWTTVIRPESRGARSIWRELWPYRDLIWLLFRRDFVSIYKQTILGPLWFLLQPLMTSGMFTLVFGQIAGIPTDGVHPFLFYMAGIMPWSYFSGCLTATANTFLGNRGIFSKVYFPRLVVPAALLMTNLVSLALQGATFLVLYLVLHARGAAGSPTLGLLLVPALVLQLAALSLGIGLIVASLTTRYRDLAMAVGFGMQLWMYATPVVYPLSQVPGRWQWLFFLNPMTAVVETLRSALFGVGTGVPASCWALSAGTTVLAVSVGLRMFHKAERTFLDTI